MRPRRPAPPPYPGPVTSTLRTLAAAAAAAALLTLAACSPSPSPQTTSSPAAAPSAEGECAGVAVVVETGDLEAEDSPAGAWCVPADEPIIAADALVKSGREKVRRAFTLLVSAIRFRDRTLTVAICAALHADVPGCVQEAPKLIRTLYVRV